MKFLSNALKHVKQMTGKKLFVLFALFLSLTAGGVVGVNAMSPDNTVDAANLSCGDSSTNSIIKNGASNRTAFINDVKDTASLKALYQHSPFDLSSADYQNFIKDAVPGVATDKGTIVVNGNVVATDVGSIGNTKACQGPNPRKFTVGNRTYWGNEDVQGKAFAPGTTAIPVDVLFNAKGQVQFAVMTKDCGNPTYFKTVTPTYECKTLNVKQSSSDKNSYTFTTSASAGHGAKITKLVYDFGDGSATKTTTNPATPVSHTFTKNSKVTVTVYVSLPGGTTVELTNCTHQITFVPPAATYACGLLTLTPGKADANGDTAYTLAASKTVAKNATIKSYTFNFGDGSPAQIVPTTSTSAKSDSHTYKPGTYTAKVLVTFVTDTGKTVTAGNNGNCAQTLTVKKVATSLTCVDIDPNKGAVNATTGATSYTFTAKASATNATITSYVFNFGDQNATQTVNSSATTATSEAHTYAASSNPYIASVTVNATDIYGNKLSDTRPSCQTTFSVKVPECKPGVPVGSPQCKPSSLTCVSLTDTLGTADTSGNQLATFVGKASADNATITNYAIDFGDGSPVSNNTVNNAGHVTVTHEYAPGTYTATLTVSGKDASGNTIQAPASQYCATQVTVQQPECKPGVPAGSNQCYTYTCNLFTISQGDNDTVTVSAFNASTTNPTATLSNVVLNWGDNSSDTPTPDQVVGTQHQYTADNTYTITATAHFTTADNTDIPAGGNNCTQTVTFTTTPTPPSTPPTTLVNTGAGNVLGLFGLSAVLGTLGYRFFLGRRLSRNG